MACIVFRLHSMEYFVYFRIFLFRAKKKIKSLVTHIGVYKNIKLSNEWNRLPTIYIFATHNFIFQINYVITMNLQRVWQQLPSLFYCYGYFLQDWIWLRSREALIITTKNTLDQKNLVFYYWLVDKKYSFIFLNINHI